jgi:short-subunit dehydrogenase
MRLNGSVGIITGASSGINAHLAERLAKRGVKLALAARSEVELEQRAAKIRAAGGRAIAVPTDVTDNDALQQLIARTEAELGPIDLLVNGAGIERVVPFQHIDPADIASIIATNITAIQALTRFVAPGMISRRRGHIVNLSSAAAKTAYPFNTVNAATKHAVVGFSWSLREELGPHGIGVSVVCPGFVKDVGLSSRWSVGKPPTIAGSVSADKVADATIRVIERNRAEVIVSPGLGKTVDVFHAISPALSTWVARRGGLYRYLEREAEHNLLAGEGVN